MSTPCQGKLKVQADGSIQGVLTAGDGVQDISTISVTASNLETLERLLAALREQLGAA